MCSPVFYFHRHGRTRTGVNLEAHTRESLSTQFQWNRNQIKVLCHVQSGCGPLGTQNFLLIEECTLLSLAAKLNATCACPSYAVQAVFQSTRPVLHAVYCTWAAQHWSISDAWAYHFLIDAAQHQSVADDDPPFQTLFWWWDCRSGVPSLPAVSPLHWKCPKLTWRYLQAKQNCRSHSGWGL